MKILYHWHIPQVPFLRLMLLDLRGILELSVWILFGTLNQEKWQYF